MAFDFVRSSLNADLRYHDTTLSKTQCFQLTSDPSGVRRGNAGAGFRSDWCSPAVVGTLSFDITASSIGIFAPAK